MKNVTMIAAVGKNLELGKDNGLIWRLKGDMKFFKENTMGKPIIMGSNTFYSLPKLLPGRTHVVLSSRDLDLDPSVIKLSNKEELLDYIEKYDGEVMIIGGARVYSDMIKYADKLLLTEIDAECKDSDVFFPSFNKDEFTSEVLSSNVENGISYKHLVYKRK